MTLRSTSSSVLEEFGRLMQQKEELKKVAQVMAAPLGDDEKAKLQQALAALTKMPAQGPMMEHWMQRLKGQADPYLKQVHDALAQRYQLWADGKDAAEVGAIPLPLAPQKDNMAAQPPMPTTASVKQADQKAYDVTGKEDIVHEAHPNKAMVSGDLVENLNQQQDADLSVAQKSAVLKALYKLAKKLQAEKNDAAYKMVKETFMDLSKSLKK